MNDTLFYYDSNKNMITAILMKDPELLENFLNDFWKSSDASVCILYGGSGEFIKHMLFVPFDKQINAGMMFAERHLFYRPTM